MPRSRGGRRTSRSCSVTLVASRNRCCGSTGAHSSSGLQLRGWSCKRFAARMMCTRGHGFGSTTSLVKSRETLRPVDSNLRGQRTFVLPRRRDAAFRRLRVASGQRADRYVRGWTQWDPFWYSGMLDSFWLQDTMPTLRQVVRECPRPSSCRSTPSPSVASDIEQPLQPLLPGRQRAGHGPGPEPAKSQGQPQPQHVRIRARVSGQGQGSGQSPGRVIRWPPACLVELRGTMLLT
eukprot:scaffold108105_cov63-Phaeocystis_antarctica.AAC.1